MYYYKLNDGTIIDVERILCIYSVGDYIKRIYFNDSCYVDVHVKDSQTDLPNNEGIKDIETIEGIMKQLTMKNVAQVVINGASNEDIDMGMR